MLIQIVQIPGANVIGRILKPCAIPAAIIKIEKQQKAADRNL